jgi:hypothetical protein
MRKHRAEQKRGFLQVWGEHDRPVAKHVAPIDRMDREACTDHRIYQLCIGKIDISITFRFVGLETPAQ